MWCRTVDVITHARFQVNQFRGSGGPFDLENGVRIVCDVDNLCANFSLPRPLCSRDRPDVRDVQTDVRRASRLNAPPLGHNKCLQNESV